MLKETPHKFKLRRLADELFCQTAKKSAFIRQCAYRLFVYSDEKYILEIHTPELCVIVLTRIYSLYIGSYYTKDIESKQ